MEVDAGDCIPGRCAEPCDEMLQEPHVGEAVRVRRVEGRCRFAVDLAAGLDECRWACDGLGFQAREWEVTGGVRCPSPFDGTFVEFRAGEDGGPLGTPERASAPEDVLPKRLTRCLVDGVGEGVALLLVDVSDLVVGARGEDVSVDLVSYFSWEGEPL